MSVLVLGGWMFSWGVGNGVAMILNSLGIVSEISFNIAALPMDISAVTTRVDAGLAFLAVAPSVSV